MSAHDQFEVIKQGTRHYRCGGCGAVGPWGEMWTWYGSIRDYEGEPGAKPLIFACSVRCRDLAFPADAQPLTSIAEADA